MVHEDRNGPRGSGLDQLTAQGLRAGPNNGALDREILELHGPMHDPQAVVSRALASVSVARSTRKSVWDEALAVTVRLDADVGAAPRHAVSGAPFNDRTPVAR